MKTEQEIRSLIETLIAFNRLNEDGSSIHGHAIRALEWVLGEYPPKPVERPQAPPPDPNVITSPFGAVRNFPNMRQGLRQEEK